MKKIQKIFLTGIFTIIPVAVSFYIIYYIFITLDNLLGKNMEKALGFQIPGAGFIMSLLLIFLVGFLTTNYLGKKILTFGELIIKKIPLIKGIYSSTKQIIEAFSSQGKDAFKQVVLLEYPRPGVYVLGFVTGVAQGELQSKTQKKLINVFVPTTPNPTSGFLLMLPESSLVYLDMSVEDGLKVLISGGIAAPTEKLP